MTQSLDEPTAVSLVRRQGGDVFSLALRLPRIFIHNLSAERVHAISAAPLPPRKISCFAQKDLMPDCSHSHIHFSGFLSESVL